MTDENCPTGSDRVFDCFKKIDQENRIKYIIPVLSDVNVHEAYSETWARIMNVLFCSFYMLEDKTDRENFLLYSNFFFFRNSFFLPIFLHLSVNY